MKTLTFTQQNDLVEKEMTEFMQLLDIEDDRDSRAVIIDLLQNCGVEFDGCSSCGRMPMDTICNNGGCQDV